VTQLCPRALGSLLSPLTTRRDYGGGILTRLHKGIISDSTSQSESQSLHDWLFTANQFVLAPSNSRLTTTDFFLQLSRSGHSLNLLAILLRYGPNNPTRLQHTFRKLHLDAQWPNAQTYPTIWVYKASITRMVGRLFVSLNEVLGTIGHVVCSDMRV
jgi:hypothetical protein